jgi:two-component system heavy metal sensor histidine kinase CusS
MRWKLIAGLMAGLTVLLGASGTIAYFHIKRGLSAQFDRSLVQRASSLAAMIDDEAGVIRIEWLEEGNDPPGHLRGIDYFSVWRKESGELLAASLDLKGQSFPRFGGPPAAPELRDVSLPGNRAGRSVGIEFHARFEAGPDDDGLDERWRTGTGDPAGRPKGALLQLVVANVDSVAPTLATLRRTFLGLCVGCALFSGLLIWLVVHQSLRPLSELKAQIARLDEAVSGQRIALPSQPDELTPVTTELNRLLARVEQAFVRERTLTSNVAHELRTPIAGLLSNLEVTLSRLRSAEEYRETTEECLEIAKRLHWLVNNLLSISRIEAGNVQFDRQPVPIARALPEWWEPFAARAAERRLRLEWELAPGASLETDPEFLRVVVTNLFDNAVSYTPEGGTIRIAAGTGGNISIANKAVDLTAEAGERVFDPFWRGSDAREAVSAHAGLGLSLSKKIIENLGGRISAQVQPRESLFIVRLEMA